MELVVKTKAKIFGTRNAWSLSPIKGFSSIPLDCSIELRIHGNENDGFNLVQSPEGFFTADSWHESINEAFLAATELFGVSREMWVTVKG